MSPALAQYGDEQIRAAVDHLGLLGELRHRVDHAQHLDHLDPRQLASGRLGRRKQAEADQLGVLVGLIDGNIATDFGTSGRVKPMRASFVSGVIGLSPGFAAWQRQTKHCPGRAKASAHRLQIVAQPKTRRQ